MSVTLSSTVNHYVGLSGDTKPTSPAGSTFYETDTQFEFISDGRDWGRHKTSVVLAQDGATALPTTDELLDGILTQLQILNVHQATITGDDIHEEDLEDAGN